jgi:hypothetical protein
VGSDNILTGDVFPARDAPMTFSTQIRITDDLPQGVVFEFGSAACGLVVWVAGADQKIMAAVGDAVAADGVTLTGPVCVKGQLLRITLACIPASGKARLWVNGKLVGWGEATSGSLPNGWSDGGNGAVGDVDTDITTRVPVGDRIVLTNAAVVAPVSGFVNQRPRQFFEVS